MTTLWKQKVDLHPTFATINRSLQDDWFLFDHELSLQRAHIAALEAAGILRSAERERIAAALDEIEQEHAGKSCPASDAEDIHTWIESRVIEFAGGPGLKLHTARSRNDQVATLLKMYVVAGADQIAMALRELISVCCRRAGDWADVVAPLQTHSQFAAPGTMGFWILRFAVGFERVYRALADARSRWQRDCPLGSAAVAGSSIPIDRAVQADRLGFEQPSFNALDSTSTRDECLELLAILAPLGLHFQSFASDVQAFSQTPFQLVSYPAAFGTGSSMMPNKSNPDAMELLRGHSCRFQAGYVELLLLLKGLPSGYNRDLQCCKPVIRNAVDEALRLAHMLSCFVVALDVDTGRLDRAMSMGNMGATLAMEQCVNEGMPLRQAHHKVAGELGSTASHDNDVYRYRTMGSAHPDETRRVAAALMSNLSAGKT